MSDPSKSVSEATIVDAYSNMNIKQNTARKDTPIPTNKLSNETLDLLEQARIELNKTDISKPSTSKKPLPWNYQKDG